MKTLYLGLKLQRGGTLVQGVPIRLTLFNSYRRSNKCYSGLHQTGQDREE